MEGAVARAMRANGACLRGSLLRLLAGAAELEQMEQVAALLCLCGGGGHAAANGSQIRHAGRLV